VAGFKITSRLMSNKQSIVYTF